jgi:hypothetical protein
MNRRQVKINLEKKDFVLRRKIRALCVCLLLAVGYVAVARARKARPTPHPNRTTSRPQTFTLPSQNQICGAVAGRSTANAGSNALGRRTENRSASGRCFNNRIHVLPAGKLAWAVRQYISTTQVRRASFGLVNARPDEKTTGELNELALRPRTLLSPNLSWLPGFGFGVEFCWRRTPLLSSEKVKRRHRSESSTSRLDTSAAAEET